MPQPEGPLSAIVVSGGKQYRVAPGDRILVDRLSGEPGAELTLDRVLMLADGDEVKIGQPAVEGATVLARVIGPAKGPKIDMLRYKSKKRVRVHRGARAGLTAIEILQVGGKPERKVAAKAEKPEAEDKAPKKKPAAPRRRAAAKKEPAPEKEEATVGT